MRTYTYTFKDNEGDLYGSEEHTSIASAKKEIKELKSEDSYIRVVETWIYEEGKFQGRWS